MSDICVNNATIWCVCVMLCCCDVICIYLMLSVSKCVVCIAGSVCAVYLTVCV